MFANLGFTEILIIMVVFLLVFGAKRLPEIGSSMGKGIREFKRSISDVDKELRDTVAEPRLESRDYRAPDRVQSDAWVMTPGMRILPSGSFTRMEWLPEGSSRHRQSTLSSLAAPGP